MRYTAPFTVLSEMAKMNPIKLLNKNLVSHILDFVFRGPKNWINDTKKKPPGSMGESPGISSERTTLNTAHQDV